MSEILLSELNPIWMFPPTALSQYPDADRPANGIVFDCPVNRDHKVRVRFENHPSAPVEKWICSGNGFDDITITPSILCVQDGCPFHGLITSGKVVW